MSYEYYEKTREIQQFIVLEINNRHYEYELRNIVDRYIISETNNIPDALQKALNEIKEKNIPLSQTKISELFMLINKPIYPQLIDESQIEISDNKIRYKDFERMINPKFLELLLNYGKPVDIIKLYFRYSTNLEAGIQWSIPQIIFESLAQDGFTYEGFASPINSGFFRLKLNYYSVYPEDEVFGSLGDFFNADLAGKSVVINPPFVESIIEKAVNKIVNKIDEINKIIIVLPRWEDSQAIKNLRLYGFKETIARRNEHYYEIDKDTNPKKIRANFESIIFTKNYDPSDIMRLWKGEETGQESRSRKLSETAAEQVKVRLPLFSPGELGLNNQIDVDWANNLVRYLYNNLLVRAESSYIRRAELITERTMPVWIAAFTHISYNPNDGENYEVLEKLGDPAMKLAFNWWIIRKFPKINEEQISRLTDHYLAKEFQGQLSINLGLSNYIRSNIATNLSVREDVLESVFGALFLVSNKTLPIAEFEDQLGNKRQFSSAFDTCYDFLNNIFEDITIDLRLFIGPVRNQVKEIFEKMRWREEKDVFNEIQKEERLDNGNTLVTLSFNRPFFTWLTLVNQQNKQQGLPALRVKNPFVQVESLTKDQAVEAAYYEAVRYLESLGITWDWANSMQRSQMRSDPDFAPYHSLVMNHLNQDGLLDYTFAKSSQRALIRYVQLLGIDENERKYILATISSRTRNDGYDESTLKQKAMEAYIKYGANPQLREVSDV